MQLQSVSNINIVNKKQCTPKNAAVAGKPSFGAANVKSLEDEFQEVVQKSIMDIKNEAIKKDALRHYEQALFETPFDLNKKALAWVNKELDKILTFDENAERTAETFKNCNRLNTYI